MSGAGDITVRVRLFASLRRFQPKGTPGPLTVTLPAGAVVRDVLVALGIPEASTGIVVCDDVHLEITSPLRDGTEVSLFPPLAGGAGADPATVAPSRRSRAGCAST